MKPQKRKLVTEPNGNTHTRACAERLQAESATVSMQLVAGAAQTTTEKRARLNPAPLVKILGALYPIDAHLRLLWASAVKQHNIAFLLDLREQLKHYAYDREAQILLEDTESALRPGQNSALITDSFLYPRCESCSRYYGTCVTAQGEHKYWLTYHRSMKTRFADKVRASSAAHLTTENVHISNRYSGMMAINSHAGNFISPLSVQEYRQAFDAEKKRKAGGGSENMHDALLSYKRKMCRVIKERFNKQYHASHKYFPKAMTKHTLNIVQSDNRYPCVVILLPNNNPDCYDTRPKDWVTYWGKTRKAKSVKTNKHEQFQQLLTCIFIAYININAEKEGIPIEMVMRSSFSHNGPSVSSTGETFRINPGLIPTCYADLIAKTLVDIMIVLHNIDDRQGEYRLKPAQELSYKEYYYHKLRLKIDTKSVLDKLKGSAGYENGFSEDNLSTLYDSYIALKEELPDKRKAGICKKPTLTHGMCAWELIRQSATTTGKDCLQEIFRHHGGKDLLISRLMIAIRSRKTHPIQYALGQMIDELEPLIELRSPSRQTKTAQLQMPNLSTSISRNVQKQFFSNPSFEWIYRHDKAFFDIIAKMMHSLRPLHRPKSKQPPLFGLYAMLELAGLEFAMQHIHKTLPGTRGLAHIAPGFGSDSDSEVSLCNKSRLYHKKIRVCSGMKAILIAHLTALQFYSKSHDNKTLAIDCTRMYFETLDAIKLVKKNREFDVTFIKSTDQYDTKYGNFLLYYDLNHNNSTSVRTTQERAAAAIDKLLRRARPTPKVVILDWTSATTSEMLQSVESCFRKEDINIVLCVSSGLKNSQAGTDYNPYGEIRIFTRDHALTSRLRKGMIHALHGKPLVDPTQHAAPPQSEHESEHSTRLQSLILKAKESSPEGLSEQTHNLVRLYKSRGHAPSVKDRKFKRHADISGMK